MVPFNCRPVSLLPIIPKVNERIVYDEINTCLIENNILYNYESGYTSSHLKRIRFKRSDFKDFKDLSTIFNGVAAGQEQVGLI